MKNIIEFPTNPVRDRIEFEQAIRDGLKDNNISPMAIEIVITNMGEFINIICAGFTFDFLLPNTIPDEFLDIVRIGLESTSNASGNSFINRLIAERVNTEIKQLIAAGEL